METLIVYALVGMFMVLLAKGRARPRRAVPAPAKVYRRRTIKSKSDATKSGE